MSDDKLEQDKKHGANMLALGLPLGLPVGIALGVSLGVALDSLPIGIAMGIGLGMALSVAFGSARLAEEKKKAAKSADEDASE
ncbi:hypothetical protein [Hyphobacterium sp.]|uniref:hypothetical protein n=1 Tax=Hyphobacterium sp. TaxID=2004662 RepID=UPI0037487D07